MGKISDFLANELLDHIFNAAYTPPSSVYLALSLAYSVRSSSYQWTASGSGTNEYYLEASGGGDPSLGGDPDHVIINNAVATEGTLGSLAAGEWGYGDNDSLGYSTIYVRLSDGADPDNKSDGYILAGGNPLDDASGLNEPSAGAYARKAIAFSAAASRQVAQNGAVNYDQETADQGWVTHWAAMTAATSGSMMAHGALSTPKQVVTGNTPSVASGEVTISISAGEVSDYLAHKLLDFAFRNQAFSAPDTYVALCTANVSDSDTGSTITEPSAGAYARKQVNPNGGSSPTWSVASARALANAADIDFADPTASWGLITALAILDAASAGNLLFYENSVTEQTPDSGDSVQIPSGDLDVALN